MLSIFIFISREMQMKFFTENEEIFILSSITVNERQCYEKRIMNKNIIYAYVLYVPQRHYRSEARNHR